MRTILLVVVLFLLFSVCADAQTRPRNFQLGPFGFYSDGYGNGGSYWNPASGSRLRQLFANKHRSNAAYGSYNPYYSGGTVQGSFSSRSRYASGEQYSKPEHLSIGVANSKTGYIGVDIPLGRREEYNSRISDESVVQDERFYTQPALRGEDGEEAKAESKKRTQSTESTESSLCSESPCDYSLTNDHPVSIYVTDGPIESGTVIARLNPGQVLAVPEAYSDAGYHAYAKPANDRQSGRGTSVKELRRDSNGEYGWKFECVLGQTGCEEEEEDERN